MVIVLLLLVLSAGCSSPTAPTPTPPVVVVPPPVTPPVVTPTRNPLLDDPRFSLSFYRMFALGTLEYAPQALRRHTQAPRIYLRTVDDAGRAIDGATLDQTATAITNTVGALTGVFGVAGLERGTDSRQGQSGWITVRWGAEPSEFCGFGLYGGDTMTLYPRTPGCRCAGGPAVRLRTVKHELGHVLGFYHTDSREDLMYPQASSCDQDPSAREKFHATIAYSQPVGSLDPQ